MNLPENYLDDNNLFYYRKCYQHITMKYSLKKIEQQTEKQTEALKARLNVSDTFEDDVDVPKRSSHSQQGSGSNNQAILPKEFILCKRNKYVKAGRSNQMCRNACDKINYYFFLFWGTLQLQ